MTVWPQSQSDSSLLEDEGHEGAEDEGEGEPWAELCPGPGARDDGARPTVPSPRIHQYITPRILTESGSSICIQHSAPNGGSLLQEGHLVI